MPDDLGLFPAAAPGRYTAREGADPWTRVDRLLLYPVLAAAGSEFAYLQTAVWLCEFLGRPPAFPPGKRPTRLEVQLAAVKILERKTVTEGMLRDESFLALAHRAFSGRRTGQPWSWTEVRLVRSLHNKRTLAGSIPRLQPVPAECFLAFLNRGQADAPVLRGMLDTLARHELLDDPPENRSADPTAVDLPLAKALTRVRTTGEESGSDFPAAWEGLYDVLGGLTSSTLR